MNDDCRFGFTARMAERAAHPADWQRHSFPGLQKEYVVHSGIILPHTGIFNVYGVPFVDCGNVNTTF
jgi:hypothetical protein